MATSVGLSPELERFDAEQRRRALAAILSEAEAEADRDGTIPFDSVLTEIDSILADAKA